MIFGDIKAVGTENIGVKVVGTTIVFSNARPGSSCAIRKTVRVIIVCYTIGVPTVALLNHLALIVVNGAIVKVGIYSQAGDWREDERELVVEFVFIGLVATAIFHRIDKRLNDRITVRVMRRYDRPITSDVVIEFITCLFPYE